MNSKTCPSTGEVQNCGIALFRLKLGLKTMLERQKSKIEGFQSKFLILLFPVLSETFPVIQWLLLEVKWLSSFLSDARTGRFSILQIFFCQIYLCQSNIRNSKQKLVKVDGGLRVQIKLIHRWVQLACNRLSRCFSPPSLRGKAPCAYFDLCQ